jgi:hypothetical protein
MDHYVATILTGVETLAWAKQRQQQAEADDADVQAVVEAEWATMRLADRLAAARDRALAVQLSNGQQFHGMCWQVGVDWLGIDDGWSYAIRTDRVLTFAGLPPALHEAKRRLPTWTSFLRGLDGPVIVKTTQREHRGVLTGIGNDHLELDRSITLPYGAIIWIRLAHRHPRHVQTDVT